VPRFHLLVAMGLALAILLALALRWLGRQRWRGATFGRRGLILVVGAACPVVSVFLVGGLQLLWHERPNQPVTMADLQILERADALLKDDLSWNRHDDKQCDDDDSTRRWSLYCAIEAACREVVGTCEHTRVASQEVRFAIEEVARGKQLEGRLMGFNNLPETRFEDIKHVLRLARERVRSRLEEREGRRPPKR
jgi:hypothetical protein